MLRKANIIRAGLVATLIAAAMATAGTAGAAVGSYAPGQLFCHDDLGADFWNVGVQVNAPYVRAANRTGYVDGQWVYWRARVVDQNLTIEGNVTRVAATVWSDWSAVYAYDNAWTRSFRDLKGGFPTEGRLFTLGRAGGFVKRLVENEVWFFDGVWQLGGTFYATPGSSGSINGVGYCSS